MPDHRYFTLDPPYVTCKAGSTKNRKEARQYIQPELAASLKAHIATKAPKAPVFNLPHESNLARMLRGDLAAARKAWHAEAKDNPQEYAQRQQSDFLVDVNHDGEITDFHCLRHTCGAWLAMTGEHPKVIQTVMRHQSITLTMDTYGHLFPGQEANAVGRLRSMLTASSDTLPSEVLRATGTDDLPAEASEGAQHMAQHSQRESVRDAASGCDDPAEGDAQEESPKPLQVADLGDVVRDGASLFTSSGGGTRTPDTRIMIPEVGIHNLPSCNDLEELPHGGCTNGCTSDCHVAAAVVRAWQKLGVFQPEPERPLDANSDEFEPSIRFIANAWPNLQPHVREAIMTLICAGKQASANGVD
ncbi:site-specific integrase [Pirellulales bacterium]|nr:site-specific integrase [Pirellulales bacterium]